MQSETTFPAPGETSGARASTSAAPTVSEGQHQLALLTAEVGMALIRAQALADMLQQSAEAVVRHLDAAVARVWTVSASEPVLELRASAGLPLEGRHTRVPVGHLKIGMIAGDRRPYLTNAVIGDPRIADQAWARREGMRAFAGYPLMVGDEVVGVLAAYSRAPLNDDDLQALATVANSLALGIERTRAEDRLRAHAERLTRLTARLARTNRELDAFAYAASHDLRAPLRGIANLAQWIEEDLTAKNDLEPETREMLELMRTRMNRMEALIEGILQYSRAGRTAERAEMVDTRALAIGVIDLLALRPEVDVEIGQDLPTIESAALPLQQIFMNLVSNAVRHNPSPHPRVAIEARDAGPFIQFSVRDNGPGIAPEYHERIWGVFQTLDARDKVEGTGIGLSLVRKLVEARGGRAWVESVPGQGATFRFLWPRQLQTPDEIED